MGQQEQGQDCVERAAGPVHRNICTEYEISRSVYYRWRDTFLANTGQAFETTAATRREERLINENQKLKQAVGELTLELKKES